jgi:ketosteroid isomerase-like protein
MRTLVLALIASLAVVSPAFAQAADPAIVAPINTFVTAFNKGDVAAAAATHTSVADLIIIDEVPPYAWHGPKAVQTWLADLGAADAKAAVTDQQVAISAPTRVEATGTAAYVIVPAVYTFKEKGVAMREAAQMTFFLKKGASGWLIHGWTWTGPKPSKAASK